MKLKHKVAVLAVGSLLAVAGNANAAPVLTIVTSTSPEVTGDAGGTVYGNTGTAGSGLPSARGGWPGSPPGFAADPSFGGALGTSGWHNSYLRLSEDAFVTFQFMGKGDASLVNLFRVDRNGDGDFVDAGETLFTGGTTNACSVAGNPPSYACTAGVNAFTIFIDVPAGGGYVPFRYTTGNGIDITNDGTNNPNDVTNNPGFMLGADPYLAGGAFQSTNLRAVFAGLTDLPALGDHDYQDLGVRISVVPEPGSLALLGLALSGLAFSRKRKSA